DRGRSAAHGAGGPPLPGAGRHVRRVDVTQGVEVASVPSLIGDAERLDMLARHQSSVRGRYPKIGATDLRPAGDVQALKRVAVGVRLVPAAVDGVGRRLDAQVGVSHRLVPRKGVRFGEDTIDRPDMDAVLAIAVRSISF